MEELHKERQIEQKIEQEELRKDKERLQKQLNSASVMSDQDQIKKEKQLPKLTTIFEKCEAKKQTAADYFKIG